MAGGTNEELCVIGGGTMGRGIAQVAALAGFQTTLVDVSHDVLASAEATVTASLAEAVRRGKVTEADASAARSRLVTATAMDSVLPRVAWVIEAVPERLDLKRSIFERLAAECPDTAILATNTSSIPIRQIAQATTCPQRVVGLHFFNPVPKMKLLEIVRGEDTSSAVIDRALALAKRMRKEPIVVRDAPGFASSRLGIAFALEAIRMVEQEVASPADIDRAMELGYRHPMGPLRLTDLVGLDVRLAIAEGLRRELGPVFEPPALLRQMVADGKLGRKSGEGFYRYPDENVRTSGV